MQIYLVNNDGGGLAETKEAAEGTTVGQFFAANMQNADPNRFMTRVNRNEAARDQPLKHGDRVSITPMKIAGA
jgi:molybdopterin converting factor small subunit